MFIRAQNNKQGIYSSRYDDENKTKNQKTKFTFQVFKEQTTRVQSIHIFIWT